MAKKKRFQKNNSVADIMKKASEQSLSVNTDDIKEIEIDKIIENELNKFSMNDDDIEFTILKESIKRTGVLQPVILKRNENDTYTIIAGHRRVRASKEVGKNTIPAVVKNYDDDNDIFDLIETNLSARKLTEEDILSSIEILENILNNSDIEITGKKSEYIGKMLNMSGKQVDRYRAVNKLIPELKEKVVNKEIGVSSITGIASLPKEKQEIALREIEKKEQETGKPVSREQANEIKKNIESIDKLIPELKEKVENKEIDLKVGAELSTLPIEKQVEAHKIIETKESEIGEPITLETTKEIKKTIENTERTELPALPVEIKESIESEIVEEKHIDKEEDRIKFMKKFFDDLISDYCLTKDIEKYKRKLIIFKDTIEFELKRIEKLNVQ